MTLLGALFGAAMLAALWAFIPFENYNFLYPGIDTKFASGYSEAAFEQVGTNMSYEEVGRLLGAPMEKWTEKDGVYKWSYTQDGKCKWADYAWLGRDVWFRDNRVVETVKRVYYD